MAKENSTIWALLVGISKYKAYGIPPLQGCVNDVEAMKDFLVSRMHVPAKQVKTLVNGEATRKVVIDSFREFLIDNPEIPKGSQILFHFSGHGSQMRDATGMEPDGLDETIVPYNSRTGNVFDIPDKTLAGLIEKLVAAKGENITIILDCCHSGSGTRMIRQGSAAVTRRAPIDLRVPPASMDADLQPAAATRGMTRSGWAMARQNHVLMAGCLDREESNEHFTQEAVFHGALTWFSLEYLKQKPPGATYADWHAWVGPKVNSIYPDQTPQCEGLSGRTIFGDAIVEREPFIKVSKIKESTLTLDAGFLHGISEGAVIGIYPVTVTSVKEMPDPLATATVENVAATTATARISGPLVSVSPGTVHALVLRETIKSTRQKVFLVIPEKGQDKQVMDLVRERILSSGSTGNPSPYLELMDFQGAGTDLLVSIEKEGLIIRDNKGNRLISPMPLIPAASAKMLQALESIARYRILLGMKGKEVSALEGKFSLRLLRATKMVHDDVTETEEILVNQGEILTIPYFPKEKVKNCYVQEISNLSKRDVYAHLFILNPDFSIYQLYPAFGQNEELKAGGKIMSGMAGSGGAALELSLPGDQPEEEVWNESREVLKLIITTTPCDLALLTQDPLEVPAPRSLRSASGPSLEALFDTIISGRATRGKPYKPSAGEDWTTAELPYTLYRASASVKLDVPEATFDLGDGITLEKPAGFGGKITLSVSRETRRGIGADAGIKLPPGLLASAGVLVPLSRRSTRGVSGQPLVLNLETDDLSRRTITPENPLRLQLPDDDSTGDYLPVAFDGEDFLPAGYGSGKNRVDIVQLPAPAGSQEPATRGLGGAIRLLILKKLGQIPREQGLRLATIRNGVPHYEKIRKDLFNPGDRVALFIHGFLSDTRWMVLDLLPLLSGMGLGYEHFLTWDYETFGTGVEDSGRELETALRQQCGFQKDDGVVLDLFAHSQGCLVARCMAEMADGYSYVDRMVLAGPPNKGTALANLGRGAVYLLSGIINNISSIPVAGAIAWPFKELYDLGSGWKDLAVDSEICKKLNGLVEPSSVPYLVLAGNNDIKKAQGARLNRLAAKILDHSLDILLGEKENDAVIGMTSMEGVRNGTYPALKVVKTAGDHFSYFSDPISVKVLSEWLTK